MRRSIRHGSDSDDAAPDSTKALEPQGERRGRGEHGLSDVSTQADSGMGVRLYRTSTPWPSVATEDSSDAPTQSASAHETMEMIPTSKLPMSRDGVRDAERAAVHPVSAPSGELPSYRADYDRPAHRRTPKYFQTDGADHRYTWEGPGETSSRHLDEDLPRLNDSAVLPTTASRQESASQRNEENAGPCVLCNPDRTVPEQDLVPAVHGGSLVVSEVCSSHGRRLSSHLGDASEIHSAVVAQDMANTSAESFSLPDPDAPSITGLNRSNQQIAKIRESEALVTQERLQTYNEPQDIEKSASSHSQSTNSSAKVEIAFPGIHHELLEQWENEASRKSMRNLGRQGPFINRQKLLGQVPLQQTLAMDPAAVKELYRCRDEHHQISDAHTFSHQQAQAVMSMYASGQPTVPNTGNTGPGTPRASRVRPSTFTRSPQGMAHSHPPTEAATEANHSFGLHISLRNVSHVMGSTHIKHANNCQGTAERERSRERNQRTFHRQPVHQQTRPNDQWLMSSAGLSPPFDESSSASSLTQNSIFSAAANSTSPTSNTTWSSLDSPIDEEVLFSDNWRNEYYMVDGKTSGFYPDRGDQPVKAMWRRVDDDGRLRCGSGMDWPRSNRISNASELVIPTRPPRPSQLSGRGGRSRDQETVDDYFQRCPAQAGRLGR